MKNEPHILILEDEAEAAEAVQNLLRKAGLAIAWHWAAAEPGFRRELGENPPDLIVSNYPLAGIDAIQALRIARREDPETPFIFFTDALGEEMVAEFFLSGATDIVSRVKPARLAPSVRRGLREKEDRIARRIAEEALRQNEQTIDQGIGELKVREAALRHSEEHFRLALEGLADYAIYLLDLEGRAASWNTGAESLTGFKAEEVLGGKFPEGLPADHPRATGGTPPLELAAAEGRVQGEGWFTRKDGTRYFAHWVISAIRDPHGRVTGFLEVAHDITLGKKHEEEIARWNSELERKVAERTAQLEGANQELEAFSYSVSHDLRAPLRHIDGFVDILQSQASQLDAEGRQHLQTIADSARQMGKLIDDLLAFSRTSRLKMNRRAVNLGQLLQEILRPAERDLKNRRVEWVVGQLPTVEGDREMLRLVFSNLIDNALKYTRPRPIAHIEIGSTVSPEEVVVFVRDNGVGFDMRYHDKLFGVFQRLHRAAEFEGTGVGLANVRRIIHRHSGRTWAEGAVNAGATFYFSLPPASEPEPQDGTNSWATGTA